MSPSPSTSAAKTDLVLSASVVIVCGVNDSLPSFSYQAILSSFMDALSTSMSPSPSTSAAKTETAPSASVVIVCGAKLDSGEGSMLKVSAPVPPVRFSMPLKSMVPTPPMFPESLPVMLNVLSMSGLARVSEPAPPLKLMGWTPWRAPPLWSIVSESFPPSRLTVNNGSDPDPTAIDWVPAVPGSKSVLLS